MANPVYNANKEETKETLEKLVSSFERTVMNSRGAQFKTTDTGF